MDRRKHGQDLLCGNGVASISFVSSPYAPTTAVLPEIATDQPNVSSAAPSEAKRYASSRGPCPRTAGTSMTEQRTKPIKTRGLKKADREADFFFMEGESSAP